MRDFKNMKRQRGRNRGGGGPSSGGGKPQHNVNRAFDSNGPDNVKIRGHAQHVFEKYQQLARDAFASGDRVLAENYLQHADHYFRLLRTIQPQRPAAEILGRDVFASGLDIDFEEEMDGEEGGDGQMLGEGEPMVEGQYQDNRPFQDNRQNHDGRQGQDNRQGQGSNQGQGRFDNRRDAEGRNDRYDGRQDGRNDRFDNRQDGRVDNRSDNRPERNDRDNRRDYEARGDNREFRDNREAREPRQGGERYDRQPRRFRDDRPPRDDRRDVASADTQTRDPLSVVAVDQQASSFPTPELPQMESSPVLRSEDGGVSEAPAFLQSGEDGEGRRPRPRRRRVSRGLEGGEEGRETTPAPAPEDA